MEAFGNLMEAIYIGLQKTVIIYGHEISLWQVFMFTLVGSILCSFIGELIDGE